MLGTAGTETERGVVGWGGGVVTFRQVPKFATSMEFDEQLTQSQPWVIAEAPPNSAASIAASIMAQRGAENAGV